ncbi:MAG: mycofactocin precursor MftA [Lapillicoccus sp.]
MSTLEETALKTTAETAPETSETSASDLLEDSLVEEVSIDGMCGVY